MMVGLAVGDALGAPVEFMEPGSFEPVSGYRSGGPHGLLPGYWTDDTSMALCSAVSLHECGEFNPADQIDRFLRWFRKGYLSSTGRCFDIGRRTLEALVRYERTGEVYAGEESYDSAGNGALMRLAPVIIYALQHAQDPQTLAREHGRLTHADPRCIESNAVFARLLSVVLEGVDKSRLLERLASWSSEISDVEVAQVVAGSYRDKVPPAIRASGYVVASLEAALWAFYRSDNFAEGALMAVNLGHDSDTIGAIFGQLAGAFYGIEAIPTEWRDGLYQYDAIVELTDAIIDGVTIDLPPGWK
ncbi:ADP-ribosylglycohydrolase family protein [Marinobacterium litorale]|uniref:ADP-ribosylglycohydrolase family protein n=1 Tax=Marinobacterium litorale TaxID=404770 RepID=UPI0003FB31D8|nr:ADP-ribosylglycohydrolase family protein [Marinobacterium litorale]